MCGLCGVYGWVGLKEKEAFYHLQVFSQLRGMDSTGVAVIYGNKHKDSDIIKAVGGVESLMSSYPKAFDWRDNSIEGFDIKCLIGHHRKATVGTINEENAHPFEYDNIIGCHNGTIFQHELKKLSTYDDKLIDSQVVLEEINKTGKIKDVIKDISGAWAFCWWDKTERTLNFCRNDKRTLFIAYSEDMRTMFWASEDWMLHTALKRSGVKYNGKIGRLNQDKHVTFGESKSFKVDLINIEVAEGYRWAAPPVASPPVPYNGGYYSGPKNDNVVPIRDEETTASKFKKTYTEGFLGTFISRRRYEFLTKKGCTCCETPLGWEKANEVQWLDDESPLCVKCAKEFEDELEQNATTATVDARKIH